MSNSPAGEPFTITMRLSSPVPPEPECAVCGEPIQWVLDMFSYTSYPHELAHARCVWTKSAFRAQERLAPDAGE